MNELWSRAIVDRPLWNQIGRFSHQCQVCGRWHSGDWILQIGASWKCSCGQRYYCDPAGRYFNTTQEQWAYE